jgi:hypothetical protein
VERVPRASEETALNPEPFDLVEGVIPLQSRTRAAAVYVKSCVKGVDTEEIQN